MGRFVRFVGFAAAGLLGLLLVGAAVVYGASEMRLRARYQVAVTVPAIPTDAATMEQGRIIAGPISHCAGCHAPNLGGQVLIDAPPFLVVPPNLTSGAGGVTASYTDEDWVRAIRHGVRPDGTPLQVMPSQNFNSLSDDDLAAIIAYVKSAPPVDNSPGASELRPLGRLLMVLGQLPLPAEQIDHAATTPPAPPRGRTPEYGRYLSVIGNCVSCHGENLAGAPALEPGSPPAANLTLSGSLGVWSEDEFIQAMRTGTRPNGSRISTAMPWELTGQMSDDDLGALYRYLRTLE